MNQWVFNSILPFVNKDVEIIGDYSGLTKKIKCKCKICNKEFENTPSNLLKARLHSSQATSKCKWSQYNKMLFHSEATQKLIEKLECFYKQYIKQYDFISYYVNDDIPVDLIEKSTGAKLSLLIKDFNLKDSKKKPIIKKKKIEKKKDKIYKFYDLKNEIIFEGTVNELVSYANRTYSYRYIDEIKNSLWFKKRFKIVRPPIKSKQTDKSLTYIHRKCDQHLFCLCYGYKCNPCLFETQPYYTKEEFKKIVDNKNINFEILSAFIDKKTPIECRCKKCGYVFEKQPRELLKGISCINCHSSKGEQLICSYLDRNNIQYIREKTFDGLKDTNFLRFDFYLTDENAIIEFDGIQHFRPTMFHSHNWDEAVANFEKLKSRDNLKNSFCKENNIPLLRIKYDEKDIDSAINIFLKSTKPKSRNNK